MANFAEPFPEKSDIVSSPRVAERRWNLIATVFFFGIVAMVLSLPILFIVSKQLGASPRTNHAEHLLLAALPDDFPAIRVKNETSSTSPSLDYAAYHAFDLVDPLEIDKIQGWLKMHESTPLEEHQRTDLFGAGLVQTRCEGIQPC